jgi:hypothetical protein
LGILFLNREATATNHRWNCHLPQSLPHQSNPVSKWQVDFSLNLGLHFLHKLLPKQAQKIDFHELCRDELPASERRRGNKKAEKKWR